MTPDEPSYPYMPYALANFRRIRMERRLYVDKNMREAADELRRYLEDEKLRRNLSVRHIGLAVVFHGWEMVACAAVGGGPEREQGPA